MGVAGGPDAGNGDDETLVAGAHNHGFRCVGVKSGSEVNKSEAHGRNAPPKVLGHVGVSKFVDDDNGQNQSVENENVAPSLVGEVVERCGVAADFPPMNNGNCRGHREGRESDSSEPRGVNKLGVIVDPGENLVGIKSGEHNHGEIGPPAALLQFFSTFLGSLLHEQNVFFLRSLVPELNGLKIRCEFTDILGIVFNPVLPGVEPRDFFEGTLPVKKLREFPVQRRKLEHTVGARDVNAHDGFAVFAVFAKGRPRIEAGVALRDSACRNVWQSDVEGTSEVHGTFSGSSRPLGSPSCPGGGSRVRRLTRQELRTCRWTDLPQD